MNTKNNIPALCALPYRHIGETDKPLHGVAGVLYMENEIWKPIPGWEGFYEVSNLGRVKSLYNQAHFLKPTVNAGQYCYVCLSKNDITRKFLVHRLVAFAFIPNPENKPHINHINSIRNDNRVDNLEWCTPAENLNHCRNVGRYRQGRAYGENHGSSVLTEKQVIEIRNKYTGKHGQLSSLAREYGVIPATIDKIVKNKKWKHLIK